MRIRSLPLVAAVAALSVSFVTVSVAQVDRTGRAPTVIGGDATRNVQRASCVLQFESTADPNRYGGSRTADLQMLSALLTSTALVDPAAQKAMSLGPDEWPRVAQVEVTNVGSTTIRLGVVVTKNADIKVPDAAAQVLLGELAVRAKAAIDQLGKRQEQAAADRLAALEKERDAAQTRLQEAQAKVRSARGSVDPNETGYQRAATANDRQTLETSLAAQRVRLKIIQDELAKGAANKASTPPPSPWQELIVAREKVRDALRARQAAGQATDLEVLEAEAKIAEAKASAAVAVRGSAGGFDSSDRWENEVLSLRIGIAESEARLEILNSRAAKNPTTAPTYTVDDLNRLQQDEMSARQALSDLTSQVEQVKRDRRTNPGGLKLNVLDGKQ